MWEPNVIGGPNRYFPVPAVDTNLPVRVFFNDVSNANQVVTIPVTFSVDMSVQSTMGNFNEAQDIVLVAGDFNGFTATSGTVMTDNGHNVWTATCNVTNTVGATENYKFLFLPFSGTPASVWEVDGLGPTAPITVSLHFRLRPPIFQLLTLTTRPIRRTMPVSPSTSTWRYSTPGERFTPGWIRSRWPATRLIIGPPGLFV